MTIAVDSHSKSQPDTREKKQKTHCAIYNRKSMFPIKLITIICYLPYFFHEKMILSGMRSWYLEYFFFFMNNVINL